MRFIACSLPISVPRPAPEQISPVAAFHPPGRLLPYRFCREKPIQSIFQEAAIYPIPSAVGGNLTRRERPLMALSGRSD